MLFNSFGFLIFFPLICILYWGTRRIMGGGDNSLSIRNLILLAGSYYFYMCWEPAYALLLLFSTIVTYLAALLIARDKGRKRLWLTAAIVLNLAILFFYKYYAFAAESITTILASCGLLIHIKNRPFSPLYSPSR